MQAITPILAQPFQAERMRQSLEEFIKEYGESDLPIKEMVEKLMTNRVKDEEWMLPGVQPREREHPLSAIFVETVLSSVTNTFIPLVYLSVKPCFYMLKLKTRFIVRGLMELETLLPCW